MDEKKKRSTLGRASTLQVSFPALRRKTRPWGSEPQPPDGAPGSTGNVPPIISDLTPRLRRKDDVFTGQIREWLSNSQIVHCTIAGFNLQIFTTAMAKARSVTSPNGDYYEIENGSGRRYRAYVMWAGEAGLEFPKGEVDCEKCAILRIDNQFWFIYPER